jgi:hypothetical protein
MNKVTCRRELNDARLICDVRKLKSSMSAVDRLDIAGSERLSDHKDDFVIAYYVITLDGIDLFAARREPIPGLRREHREISGRGDGSSAEQKR